MADEPKLKGDSPLPSGVLEFMDRWRRVLVAVVALLTVVAQLWSLIENRWQLAIGMLILMAVAGAFYAASRKFLNQRPLSAQALEATMIGLLVAIPVIALAILFLYSVLPREQEAGTSTTVAVAEFDGPPLPDPYKDCRPSDMLVHTLSRVGARFGGLKAFELPYSISPDNRLANLWAQFHGWFDAADIIVYGEYTLYNSSKVGPSGKADEIVINPEVANVPLIPVGYTSAPLYSWNFAGSVARIQDLCGSDLNDAGPPARFLDDARRGAAAISGLQALGKNDFQTAEDAQREAQRVEVASPAPCAGDPNQGLSKQSDCPGVLAFYLATIDARLGTLQRAAREYRYAAARLGTPEPYLDLGELYMRLGNPVAAFNAFDAAVNANPNSVAALATRAQYERDWLRPREAAIDLARAIDLENQIESGRAPRPPGDLYNRITLSRALFQRGGGAAACGIEEIQTVLYPNGTAAPPDSHVGAEALVEYAIWSKSQKLPGAEPALRAAVQTHPEHVHANYALGLMLEGSKPPNKVAATYYLRRAEYALAITDEDFLYQANAANELAKYIDTDPIERNHDFNRARDGYARSIAQNPGAVYAYYGRAQLEEQHDPTKAFSDLRRAAVLHPDDALLQSALAQVLDKLGRHDEGTQYHERAKRIAQRRIPKDEYGWSSQTCSYAAPPIGGQ